MQALPPIKIISTTMNTPRVTTAQPVLQEDWENPEIQRIGTEPERASFFPFPIVTVRWVVNRSDRVG
jgi:hypothetical protein